MWFQGATYLILGWYALYYGIVAYLVLAACLIFYCEFRRK